LKGIWGGFGLVVSVECTLRIEYLLMAVVA